MVTTVKRCGHGFLDGQCTLCKEKVARRVRVDARPQQTEERVQEKDLPPVQLPPSAAPRVEATTVAAITHPILGTPLVPLSTEELALKQQFQQLPLGVTIGIPANRIKPLGDQPRKYFNRHRIARLKESIVQREQRQPVEVRWLPNDPYWFCELIDGERRLRATLAATEPGGLFRLIKVVVRRVENEEAQFEESAIANAGREGYTPLELGHIIHRLNTKRGRSLDQIATDLNITSVWAFQVQTLVRLHESLKAKMSPEVPRKERLGLTLAIQLARIHDQNIQVTLLQEIRAQKMSVSRAVRYVRNRMSELGLVDTDLRERRSPNQDYGVVNASLEIAITRLQIIEDLEEKLKAMFEHRTPEDLERALKRAELIRTLAENVHNALQECHAPIPAEPVTEVEEALAV